MNFQVDYKKLAVIAALIVLVVLQRYVVASLLPFFLAFLLAGLIDAPVNFLEARFRAPRSLAVVAVLLCIVLAFGYMVILIFTQAASELVDLARRLPDYEQMLVDLISGLSVQFETLDKNSQLPPEVSRRIKEAFISTGERAVAWTGDTVNRLFGAMAALPGFLVILIIALIATYFLSKDRSVLSRAVILVTPPHWHERLHDVGERIRVDLLGFMRAQLMLLAVTTTVAAVGLSLLQSRYWMILAMASGILDLIPVVGPGLIFFPWIGMALLLGNTAFAVKLLILFGVILGLRQVLQAKILGDSIGIHPLMMLVALYAGIIIFGVKGLLIGPFLVIVVKAALNTGIIRFYTPAPKS